MLDNQPDAVAAPTVVKYALRDLGKEVLTYGCAKHARYMFFTFAVKPWSTHLMFKGMFDNH